MPTPAELYREYAAQRELERLGSLMSGGPRTPQNPLLATISTLVNALGPTPVDALTGKAAQLAGQTGLVQMLASALGLGGQSGESGGTEAGIYRQLGMQRAGGALNPAEYLARLAEQPNYQRYLQLVQNMVRRGLGESFLVSRGKGQTDPLVQALQHGLVGADLPATAVTYGPLGDIAEGWARISAEKSRKPAYVASGMARPEDVAALVPRRQAFAHEREFVLKPTETFKPQLTAKYIPPSGQFPWVERKALSSADPTTSEILAALAEAAQPPTP